MGSWAASGSRPLICGRATGNSDITRLGKSFAWAYGPPIGMKNIASFIDSKELTKCFSTVWALNWSKSASTSANKKTRMEPVAASRLMHQGALQRDA